MKIFVPCTIDFEEDEKYFVEVYGSSMILNKSDILDVYKRGVEYYFQVKSWSVLKTWVKPTNKSSITIIDNWSDLIADIRIEDDRYTYKRIGQHVGLTHAAIKSIVVFKRRPENKLAREKLIQLADKVLPSSKFKKYKKML